MNQQTVQSSRSEENTDFFQRKQLLNTKPLAKANLHLSTLSGSLKYLCALLMVVSMAAQAIEVQVDPKAPAMVRQAAEEIKNYAKKMTRRKIAIRPIGKVISGPVIRLTENKKMGLEEWKITSVADGVEISGGSLDGVLYGAYHYLEDICGVRWWTPWEEYVPSLKELPVAGLALKGKPAFNTRVLHAFSKLFDPIVYDGGSSDNGRFASRMRFNGDSSFRFPPKYGGFKWIGGPGCHSFAAYMPSSKYFDKHPEWYSLIKGKRFRGSHYQETQLCLSNPEVRKKMVEEVRKIIKKEYVKAAKLGVVVPYIFDISQNDNLNFCQCKACQAIVDREGGKQSGIVIDFVNAVVGELTKEYPNLLFQTFAYCDSEDPPAHIKPADNVIVVLTDTTSNMARTVADEKYNPIMNRRVREWGKISRHLKIWDYNINYVSGLQEQPYPSEYTYADDSRFYRANHVSHIFTEHEKWFIADVRDYKVWLYCHLVENPDLDFKQLSRDFALGYYGPQAGKLFLRYRQLLRDAIVKNNSVVNWNQRNSPFLSYDLIAKSQALFDQGTELIGDNKVLQRRWRSARISLDRATLLRQKELFDESQKLYPGKSYPFDPQIIRKRLRQAWTEQAKHRTKASDFPGVLNTMESWFENYAPTSLSTSEIPEKFKDIERSRVFDFNFIVSGHGKAVVLLEDRDSLSGQVLQIKFPNKNKAFKLEKYKLPMNWGVYSYKSKKGLGGGWLKPEAVPQNGYNWYRLGRTKLLPGTIFYVPASWAVNKQIGTAYDPAAPDTMFDVWLRVKFTGPAFPHGKAGEPDALWFDRLVLVKDYSSTPKAQPDEIAVKVNGVPYRYNPVDGWFHYSYNVESVKNTAAKKEELPSKKSLWLENAGILYGLSTDLVLKFESPEAFSRLDVKGVIGNYGDNLKRSAYLAYSLDGKNYKKLNEVTYGGGLGQLNGAITLPKKTKTVWVKLGRNVPNNQTNWGSIIRAVAVTLKK